MRRLIAALMGTAVAITFLFHVRRYSKLTDFYHASVIESEWNASCITAVVRLQWRSGERHEDLSADHADRCALDRGPLHFDPGTAPGDPAAIAGSAQALSDRQLSRHRQRQYPLPGQNFLHLFIRQR